MVLVVVVGVVVVVEIVVVVVVDVVGGHVITSLKSLSRPGTRLPCSNLKK